MLLNFQRIKISRLYNVLTGFIFLLAGIVIIVLVNMAMKQEALREAEDKARIILDRNLATHTYFSHDLKPALFALTDKHLPAGYFDPTWMSSTFAIRQINRYAQSPGTTEYYYKECAVGARSPENEADPIEREFIEALNRGAKPAHVAGVRTIEGKPYFVVMKRGETLEESCLRCHSTPERAPADLVARYGPRNSFNREVGEVISAISIRVPLAAAYAGANRFSLILSAMLVAVLALKFVVQIWIGRRLIFTPLNDIRDKAIQISSDERHLGEEIRPPAGQELADLTSAFNAMSGTLRSDRDNLEEQVKARTRELQNALDNVKTLRGLLPICSSCKKIRNDDGYWSQIEVFVRDHSDAEFSHGICPDCARKFYPDYFRNKDT